MNMSYRNINYTSFPFIQFLQLYLTAMQLQRATPAPTSFCNSGKQQTSRVKYDLHTIREHNGRPAMKSIMTSYNTEYHATNIPQADNRETKITHADPLREKKWKGKKKKWQGEMKIEGKGEWGEREKGVVVREGRVGNCIISDAFTNSRAVRVRKLRCDCDVPFRTLVRDNLDYSHALYWYVFCKRRNYTFSSAVNNGCSYAITSAFVVLTTWVISCTGKLISYYIYIARLVTHLQIKVWLRVVFQL